MERPIAVANFFIRKAIDTGESITPMKIVKLVYIAHGWHLGLTSEPLINEAVQAWKYGPVVKSLYYYFKRYGNEQITSLEFDVATMTTPITSDRNLVEFLDKIWEIYGRFSALELSTMTHTEGSPWFTTWENEEKNILDTIIPNNLIKEHYIKKANAEFNSAAH